MLDLNSSASATSRARPGTQRPAILQDGSDGRGRSEGDAYRAALASQLGVDPDADVRPLYIVNFKGRIVYCNRAFAEITGYQQKEIVGRLSVIFYVPEATPIFLMRRAAARKGLRVAPKLNTRIRAQGGSTFAVELSVRNLLVDGRVAARVATLRRIEPETPARRSKK